MFFFLFKSAGICAAIKTSNLHNYAAQKDFTCECPSLAQARQWLKSFRGNLQHFRLVFVSSQFPAHQALSLILSTSKPRNLTHYHLWLHPNCETHLRLPFQGQASAAR